MRISDPPVRAWLTRIPDVVLLAILGAMLTFAYRTEVRLTRIETKLDAALDSGIAVAQR